MRYTVLLSAIVVAACSGGERRVAGPGEEPRTPQPPTLTVHLELTDPSLREVLGWEAGVPQAEVHILRNGEATYQTATTDGSGDVRFAGILDGLYRIYATRRLSTSETQASSGEVRAFGDGGEFNVGGSTTVTLDLEADHPGGLVISELNNATPPPWETGGSGYLNGMYIEVYNNSSSTIFLDGKIFGRGYVFGFRDYSFNPCTASQSVREDASGILTRQALQFPGSGTEYPIEAGGTRIIAVEAIDHRPVHPWLLDLSGADFEIKPDGGVDNPAVPNMIHVGEEGWRSLTGLLATTDVYFLSGPVELSSLPVTFRDTRGQGYVRVPADLILDAVSFETLWPDYDLEFPTCDPMVNERFDRYELAIMEIGPGVAIVDQSYQRRFLRDEGGRRILQDTNTTAADFVLSQQTPGTITP